MLTRISSPARRTAEPDLADLRAGDFKRVLVRAAKRTMADNMTSGPNSINKLVDKLSGVVPASAQDLIRSNLQQVSSSQGGRVMVIVGLVLAVASLMGAVQTAMWGLNIAYERREQRNFIRQRVSAFLITLILTTALVAVFAVLVLAPYMTGWVGQASGYPGAVSWLWWTLQWPVLFALLL